jgi:hypothetical protein
LIVQLSFAQDGYPKQIVLEDDTFVLFKPFQVSLINYNKVSFDECVALNKSYLYQVSLLEQSSLKSKEIEFNLYSQIKNYDEQLFQYEIQIENYEKTSNKLERKIKVLKLSKLLYGGASLVGGFYLGNKLSTYIKL